MVATGVSTVALKDMQLDVLDGGWTWWLMVYSFHFVVERVKCMYFGLQLA